MARPLTQWTQFTQLNPAGKVCWQNEDGLETGSQVRSEGRSVSGRKTIYPIKGGSLIVNEELQTPARVQINGQQVKVNAADIEPMLEVSDYPKQVSQQNCPLTLRFTDPVSAAGFFLTLQLNQASQAQHQLFGARLYAELTDGSVTICDSNGFLDPYSSTARNNTVTAPFVGVAADAGGPQIAKLYADANSMNFFFPGFLISALYWQA